MATSLPTEWIPEPIELGDLTTATVDGTGVFDVLMKAMKGHLEQEYSASRIKGTEYASVYLGALDKVLQNSVTFLLQKDKAALDAKLVEAQIELTGVQKEIAEVELQKALAELPKIEAEIRLIEAQICKAKAEYDVLMESKLKTANEAELLLWKIATEKAQTLSVGVDPDSVIGKQKALYGAQADGFSRDAEQKAAKLMTDVWSVQRTTDSGVQANDINKLDNVTIGLFIEKLKTGVGA